MSPPFPSRPLHPTCRSGLRPSREPAFALPLAAGAAGLLLLMGGSLQGLTLQERLQSGALERLRREEDLLHSAAHQLLAALNGPLRCLLPLALERWAGEGSACTTAAEVAGLMRLEVMQVPVRLLAWQPGAGGRTATLELALEGGPGRAPRRGRFEVDLEGLPVQALDLRALALAGAVP